MTAITPDADRQPGTLVISLDFELHWGIRATQAAKGACRQALWSGLAAKGLSCIGYELNQALRIALEHPDAEPRWLAGEDVFAGIDADEVTGALGEPNVRLYLEVIAAAATGRSPPPNEWL